VKTNRRIHGLLVRIIAALISIVVVDPLQAGGTEHPSAVFWQSENGSIETYFVKISEVSLRQRSDQNDEAHASATRYGRPTSLHSFEVAPVVFRFEYDLFWKGWVTSHLSEADPGFNDPENHQGFGEGFGVRFAFQLRNHVTARFAWYLEPFFRYWDVDQSDYAPLTYYGIPIGFVYEPENNTLAYGLTIGFGF